MRNELHTKVLKIGSLLLNKSHKKGVDQQSINPIYRNAAMKSVEMSGSATNTAAAHVANHANFEIKINTLEPQEWKE